MITIIMGFGLIYSNTNLLVWNMRVRKNKLNMFSLTAQGWCCNSLLARNLVHIPINLVFFFHRKVSLRCWTLHCTKSNHTHSNSLLNNLFELSFPKGRDIWGFSHAEYKSIPNPGFAKLHLNTEGESVRNKPAAELLQLVKYIWGNV